MDMLNVLPDTIREVLNHIKQLTGKLAY